MSRRHLASLALSALACLIFEFGTPLARTEASSLTTTTYQLVDTAPAGSSPIQSVVAIVTPYIQPSGAIVAPSANTSPLTILSGSSGFDQSNLQVSLGQGTDGSNNPLQALALQFNNGGLQPGGVLNFSLNTSPSLTSALQFSLPSTSSDVVIKTSTGTNVTTYETSSTGSGSGGGGSGSGSGGGSGSGTATVPEPISLLVWSSIAGLGVMSRRRRPHVR